MRAKLRRRNGSSVAEAAIAAIILVPIALAILDVIVVVSAIQMNDTAAKNAARAAANQLNQQDAGEAAQNALSTFHKSSIIKRISVSLKYSGETVVSETSMDVHLPIPFPGFSELTFNAKDVEPIVTHN